MRRLFAVSAIAAVLAVSAVPLQAAAQPASAISNGNRLDFGSGAGDYVVSDGAVSRPAPFDLNGIAEELVLVVVTAVAGVFIRRAQLSRERKEFILTAGQLAYGAVNELARRSANRVDDKVAKGLGIVLELLQANGQKPLSPGEQATVKVLFDSMHGQEAKRLEAAELAAPKVVNVTSSAPNAVAANPQTPPAL